MEVVNVYEVYLDVFFIDNILTNLFVLMAVLLVMGVRVKLLRAICASGVGAMVSVGILYFRLGYGIIYVFIIIATDFIMLYIVGIYKRKSINGTIYMNAIAFAYSKLNDCIDRLTGWKNSYMTAIVLIVGLSLFVAVYARLSKQRAVYKVVLVGNGGSFEAKALYDSGNLLTEPVSGKAVSIIEKSSILEDWMKNTPEKFKIIPYKSVGEENGILEGMVIDQLIIQYDDKKVVEDKAVIALYDGKLSSDGRFEMILNHNLM
jgi:sigma-E processing peptidase SpoIIGA